MSNELEKREDNLLVEKDERSFLEGVLAGVVSILSWPGTMFDLLFRLFGYELVTLSSITFLRKKHSVASFLGFVFSSYFICFALLSSDWISYIGWVWLFTFFGIDIIYLNLYLGKTPKKLTERKFS